jgi:hypothetical protein
MVVWERVFTLQIFNTFRTNDFRIKPINLVMVEFNLRRNFKVVRFQSKGQLQISVVLLLRWWCCLIRAQLCRCHGRIRWQRIRRRRRRGRQRRRRKRQWRRRRLPLRQRRRCFPELLFYSYFRLTLLNFFRRRNNWSQRLGSFGGACLRRRSIDCFRHGCVDFVLCGVVFRLTSTYLDCCAIFQRSVKIFLWHQIQSFQLQAMSHKVLIPMNVKKTNHKYVHQIKSFQLQDVT